MIAKKLKFESNDWHKQQRKAESSKPNFNELIQLSAEIQCNGYFVFTFDSDNKDILTYGRMFAPAIGINEDPVTGNANGPLGGYLIQNKIVTPQHNTFCFRACQGEAINRLGCMTVYVEIDNDTSKTIQIKGDAVVAFKTEVFI